MDPKHCREGKICLCFFFVHSTFLWTSLLLGKEAALFRLLPLTHSLPTHQHIQAGTHSTTSPLLEQRERRGRYEAQEILSGAETGASSKTRDLRGINGKRENILQMQNMRYTKEKPRQRKVLLCLGHALKDHALLGSQLGKLTWKQSSSQLRWTLWLAQPNVLPCPMLSIKGLTSDNGWARRNPHVIQGVLCILSIPEP